MDYVFLYFNCVCVCVCVSVCVSVVMFLVRILLFLCVGGSCFWSEYMSLCCFVVAVGGGGVVGEGG